MKPNHLILSDSIQQEERAADTRLAQRDARRQPKEGRTRVQRVKSTLHPSVLVGGVGQRRGARPRLVQTQCWCPRDVGCRSGIYVWLTFFSSVQFRSPITRARPDERARRRRCRLRPHKRKSTSCGTVPTAVWHTVRRLVDTCLHTPPGGPGLHTPSGLHTFRI